MNIDYTFILDEKMILGTSNPVKRTTSFGGVIRNVAENLARLDQKISLMSLVGDDIFGDELLNESKKMMEVFATDKIKNEKTGSYYAVINPKGNMDIGFADMSINDLMTRSWITEHKKHLNMGSWIIADLNISKDGVEALLEYKKEFDKKLAIVGVSGPKMKHLPQDLSSLDVLICNLDETQTYCKTVEADTSKLCKLWLDKGIKKIVITEGSKGCTYGDIHGIRHQNAIKVLESDIVDVTGAGDAFSAATLYGLILGNTLQESILYGISNASLTIKAPSAVNPKLSIKLINEEIKKNEI
jgi:sugar/nucleoside kinase (ribokinase family)